MSALYLGLMSGTSMDGVDAALCEFDGQHFLRVRAIHARPYEGQLRADLLRLQREQPAVTLDQLSRLDQAVAGSFADAAGQLLDRANLRPADVRAIGSHGQTVFHDPAGAQSSLQLGNPALIAAATGVTTVADFRRADIAHGGQGAPLVPAFHHAVFASAGQARCIVNIGGIANITVLPNDDPGRVRGFDTGPGNGLLDEWAEARLQQRLDEGGQWAASGRLDPALLQDLLADPYFAQTPPKSTGRGYFNLDWARRCGPRLAQLPVADVQRTLCELTARSIVDAIQRHAPATRQVLICGGGAHNRFLRERLKALIGAASVSDTSALGLDPGAVEPAAFAWLAMRTLEGLPGNLPAVTGARKAVVLGGIYRA